jgi:hypothetical protein
MNRQQVDARLVGPSLVEVPVSEGYRGNTLSVGQTIIRLTEMVVGGLAPGRQLWRFVRVR